MHLSKSSLLLSLMLFLVRFTYAGDIKISGSIKDVNGNTLNGASVTISNGTSEYSAVSKTDGSYQLIISITGINEVPPIDIYPNFPNPFSERTYIPVNVRKRGPLLFSVYNIVGQKIWEISYSNLSPGIFYIGWDGTTQNGRLVQNGIYIYTIAFQGKRYSRKMLKAGYAGITPGTLNTSEQVFTRLKSLQLSSSAEFFAKVTASGFYPINRLKTTFTRDTVINFTLYPTQTIPFRTSANYLNYWDYQTLSYKTLFLKGINLGTSPPGFFPGEIGYAIQAEQYERWIARMAGMGFNCLRIYTLHPPVFYEKLAQYNEAHPEKPLYLFQGIWLEEDTLKSSHDLHRFTSIFESGIEEVVNCVHGNKTISERLGRSYGKYTADVSQWIMGYIIGREIGPIEIKSTNQLHPSNTSYTGTKVSLASCSPSEAWLAARVDKLLVYEKNMYNQERPVSVSSWPTLDPLTHPTEPASTDEDAESFDLANINLHNAPAGYFASFHAYPYFPNFVNEDPEYQKATDALGANSYLGYIKDLKNHYKNIPLVIAEFGVPSSWGSAHQSSSGMHHGGHTEVKQGEYNIRMLKNMYDVNCGGGMMFAWMDEWWKPTWIVELMESKGFFKPGETVMTPTKQLWLNLCSAEDNFGLIAFDYADQHTFSPYALDNSNSIVSGAQASYDDHYFHLKVDLPVDLKSSDTLWIAFDTHRFNLGESVLPDKSVLDNRAEFALQIPVSSDTAFFYVTRAYDMFGLTVRYNDADTVNQLFRTIATDGKPWNLMRWKNSSNPDAVQDIGKILMKRPGSTIAETNLHGVFLESRKVTVRIPWTMLYISDPTRREIVDGFISFNEGWSHLPIRDITAGIAISVAKNKQVVNTTSRYAWPDWWNKLQNHTEREKASVPVIEKGLLEINSHP